MLMKSYLKNVFKSSILFFGLFLVLINCQKDDTAPIQEIEEISENNLSINYVSGDKIPNIINLLGADNGASSKSNSSKSNTISARFGTISIESVLEVIDTLGNENYSFTLVPKTPKPNSIFNLVVNASNGATKMAIMEYRMAPDFAQDYFNGSKTLAEFTGSIFTFPFDPNSNLFAKGDTCIQNIDEVVNCDRITLDRGTIVASGGGGSTTLGDISVPDGGNSGGGYSTGGGGSAVWVCDRFDEQHPGPTNCGNGGGTWIIIIFPPNSYTYKSNNTKKGGDCCDGTDVSGSIGVNLLTPAISFIVDCLGEDTPLTDNQMDWLSDTNNTLKVIGVKNYLQENECSDEAKEFGNLAIEALRDGGEVDFDDNVVLSKEFKDNEKLKCVYDKLAGDNSSLFKDTIGAFIDNPDVNIVFTVGNCVSTNIACTKDQYVDETGIITVIIEDIDANPIEVAQILLHEAIHAEIAKFVSEFESGVEINNRPNLFQLYAYHKSWADSVNPNYNWDNGADHQYMITNYVNRIANTLRQFDNNRYPIDYYKDYAWDGLRDNYNYTGTLTDSDAHYFTSLRPITNTGIEVCNQ